MENEPRKDYEEPKAEVISFEDEVVAREGEPWHIG